MRRNGVRVGRSQNIRQGVIRHQALRQGQPHLREAMMDDERDMTEDERREARATLERAMLQIPRFNREMFWFVVILLVLALIYNL